MKVAWVTVASVASLWLAGCDSNGEGGRATQNVSMDRSWFERMSDDSAEPNLDVSPDPQAMTATEAQELDSEVLGQVVAQHRPSLHRCYQVANRGLLRPEAVRVDLDVKVDAQGSVVEAKVRGRTDRLASCLENEVASWAFPTTADDTQGSFPIVFQPGG